MMPSRPSHPATRRGFQASGWRERRRQDPRGFGSSTFIHAMSVRHGNSPRTRALPTPGEGMTPSHLTLLTRQYVEASSIGKTGACHLFRHAMATLMLEGGADVRMIQAMLGHASLETTALYTHVAIRTLKEVHERTHPGARLGKRAGKTKSEAKPEADVLLSALAGEAEDDQE
jgi:integrase/recombinase XerD